MTTRILLADDHTLVRSGIRALLESAGYEIVAEAADGPTLLAAIRAAAPDVAFVDVSLGGSSGIDAVRALKKSGTSTRMVMLSMHDEPQYIYEAMAAGADGYVLKDAAFQDLPRAIEAVLTGGQYLSAGAAQRALRDYTRRARRETTPTLALLSPREREVLSLIAEGFSRAEIGQRLGISIRTADTHRKHIMEKLELHSTADLTRFAIRHGLCDAE